MSYSAAYINMQRYQAIKPTPSSNDNKKETEQNVQPGLSFGFDKSIAHQKMQLQQGSFQSEQGLSTNQIKTEQGLFKLQPETEQGQPIIQPQIEQKDLLTEQGLLNIQTQQEQGSLINPAPAQQGSLLPEQEMLPGNIQPEQGIFNIQPQFEQGVFIPEQGQFQPQQERQEFVSSNIKDIQEFIPTPTMADLNNLNPFETNIQQKSEFNLPKIEFPKEHNFFTETKNVSMPLTVYNFDISTDEKEDDNEKVEDAKKEDLITDKKDNNTQNQPSGVTEEQPSIKQFMKLSGHLQPQSFVKPTQNEEIEESADTEPVKDIENEIAQSNNAEHEFEQIKDEIHDKMTNFFTTGGHFEPDEVFIYSNYLNANREQTTRQAFEYKQQLRTDIPMQINQNEVRADFVAGRTTKIHSTTSKVTETDNQKGGNSGSNQRNPK